MRRLGEQLAAIFAAATIVLGLAACESSGKPASRSGAVTESRQPQRMTPRTTVERISTTMVTTPTPRTVPRLTTTIPATRAPTTSRPIQTSVALPTPRVPQAPPAIRTTTPSGNCDPNYSGACVPIASDVDCAGGKGNGPAYVRGPVRVVGSDIYGLDRNGDGIGCER